MALNIKPIADRVVVEAAPAEEKTASGIYIPDTAKEKPQQGTVVAVGPGKYAELTGNLVPLSVKVGDVVLYGKYGGTEITFEGKEYLIMRETDLTQFFSCWFNPGESHQILKK
ncbi:co-chaperone GroES [Pedobacter sp. NJ-S-72]